MQPASKVKPSERCKNPFYHGIDGVIRLYYSFYPVASSSSLRFFLFLFLFLFPFLVVQVSFSVYGFRRTRSVSLLTDSLVGANAGMSFFSTIRAHWTKQNLGWWTGDSHTEKSPRSPAPLRSP